MEIGKSENRAKELRHILRHKDVTNDRKKRFLECLSWLFLDQQYTESVCHANQDIILDIVTRCRDFVDNTSGDSEVGRLSRQLFSIALSRSLEICPDVKRFAADYLQDKGYHLFATNSSEKIESAVSISRAAWRLVCGLGSYVENCITLDSLLNFLMNHQNNQDVIWYCTKTIAQRLNMTSSQWQTLLSSYITDPNDAILIQIRHEKLCRQSRVTLEFDCKLPLPDIKRIKQTLGEEAFHKSVAMVSGIQLPKIRCSENLTSPLVPVPSLTNNLRRLALAVSAGSAVLLQGPVGSGKTSLVEHLAALTGRSTSPYIMKVQLGDQTDSKALLGTYRCTEIPGEFVWQPGILTRAVKDGHWVLMEDIDYAPMDVVSVLLPLLERGMLSLPGHGDTIQAAPGFRMFATQRLLVGSSGWHRQQSGSAVLLEKMWTKINIEPLGREELQQVITTRYPGLSTVVDRLLDIYFMVSAGKHELYHNAAQHDGKDSQGDAGKFLSSDGRLISTRDLMSWCCRIAVDFDVSSTETASLVLQEALDCFVACIPNPQRRIQVAEAIGAKLNITKIKAEYYCCKYKPPVTVTATSLSVGRTQLQKNNSNAYMYRPVSKFSFTLQSSVLLERVATCVSNGEPVLLVGETGTGKTSTVQYLSEQLGHKLHVINMNQQSDSTDLLGGFKPMDMRHVVRPFREEFEVLFCETFSRAENARFLGHIQECYTNKKWDSLFTLVEHTIAPALKRKDAGKLSDDRYVRWLKIRRKVQQLRVQIQQSQNILTFAFVEGTLVKALRNGDWVLLDEINLAAAETLECLSGLLESRSGSVVLTERGDVEPVIRHENFRLFACMNPATDVGKKDLPIGIRNRFTELYVDELEESRDLVIMVSDYLSGLSLTSTQLDGIVKFYLTAKEAASQRLMDGTGRKPHYSLRTLCRALKYAAPSPCGQTARSLYEGFCLSFLTQLDRSSHPFVEKLVCQHVIGKSNIKAMLKQPLPEPTDRKCLNIEGYWISVGTEEPNVPDNYIMTPSVRANLKDLVRVVSSGQHPVLLQGETSVGKTSLVTWLAQTTGNTCVRVNNHEHTDLQEYVGCYTANQTGKLVFKEGVLVEAMRKGHWIILDELNLAPTDVLEALNRLLDDNRELFIPETQEVVKAHPKFMLYATQNPPGQYGGRKFLSRAFRNRFVELHFDEIPSGELETILHRRCDIPLSYAKRLVATMIDLQTRRRGSGVFAGKQGFITLRDLFRWADRYKCQDVAEQAAFYDWDQHMADHGYMLLAGRVRKPEEALVVRDCIQKHLKRTVDPEKLFCLTPQTSPTTVRVLQRVIGTSPTEFQHIVWTYGMRRLAVLIGHAIRYNEPVLLVGETGCGKTTISQLYACLSNTKLHSINCHLHTESADFLGGLRPCRAHDDKEAAEEQRLFEWVDGPLVNAMREGSMFLIDEISLADDSVLERLNSVLEPERSLLLAEKGGGDGGDNKVDHIRAAQGFQVFATMNPGGDFGKKELSPALRNRFTEIWCPQSNDRQDFINIIEHNLRPGIHLCNQEDGTSGIGRAIMDFIQWFTNNDVGKKCTVSVRDILSWVNFINSCSTTVGYDCVAMDTDSKVLLLDPAVAFLHGACLVFLDGLGAGTTSRGRESEIEDTRNVALKYLLKIVNHMTHQSHDLSSAGLIDKHFVDMQTAIKLTEDRLTVWPFSISQGPKQYNTESHYALSAPTTCVNAQRVLRALQLPRPVLLEGSPGVGKTSLVSAIARASGRELVRINLSEQTDVTDLFGADLPVEGHEGGVFAWRDGPLLRALREGHWIVLDELNLASQSVLEGLNACLDHRAEVFIPELGKTFHIQHEKTRLFACQNPLNQGGGRKGLPRSFLNRFTQVYMEQLTVTDQQFIAHSMYPEIPTDVISHMVNFNMQIYQETMMEGLWGQKGGPWEFNLRDLFRWCDLLMKNQPRDKVDPGEYVGLLYTDRFRTIPDKEKVQSLYQRVFSTDEPPYTCSRIVCVTQSYLQVGHSFLKREGQVGEMSSAGLSILHHCIGALESVMKCVEMNWMSILIGPQSCGKTCLVHLLSQLTGNRLRVVAMNSAMDTTELLGGFEQCDVGRHLEDYQAGVTELMSQLQVHLLLRKDTSTILTIQSKYTKLTELGKIDEKMSSTEVLQKRRNHFSCLKDLFQLCAEYIQNHDVTALMPLVRRVENKGSRVELSLARAKPGSGGGAFEWIDSLLVQALQTGDWLLIDNVNFCNASVLDRLNALLEPNGELSINERGIIDGQIPTVKPHPNFRLFLTMDPKFGEISRAMRNRGVEIYITGEDEGTPYSVSDVKVMMQNSGLNDKAASDWLINLHSDLCHHLPRGERPGILDLLQAALVTKQQTDRDTSIQDALRNASLDSYVRSIKATNPRKIAMEIWESHRDTIPSGGYTDDSTEILLNRLSCADLCSNPGLAHIVLCGEPLLKVLQQFKDLACNSNDNVDTVIPRSVRHSWMLVLNLSSQSDWTLCCHWIQCVIGDFINGAMGGVNSSLINKLKEELKCLKLSVDAVDKFVNLGETKKCLTCTGSKEFQRLLEEGPVDGRWNIQRLNKTLNIMTSDERLDTTKELLKLYDRFHEVLFVASDLYSSSTLCEKVGDFIRGKDARELRLPVLADLLKLFQNTDAVLGLYQGTLTEKEQHILQVSRFSKWWTRLVQATADCIDNTDGEQNYRLHLYWEWFYNKMVTPMLHRLPPALVSLINHIHCSLGTGSVHSKTFLVFWKSNGHPYAFETKGEAEREITLQKLSQRCDMHNEVADMLMLAKAKLWLNEGNHVTQILMNCAHILKGKDNSMIDEFLHLTQTVQRILLRYGLIQSTECGDTYSLTDRQDGEPAGAVIQSMWGQTTSQPCQMVELWPLFEHTKLTAVQDYVSSWMGGEMHDGTLDALYSFSLLFTPSQASELTQYNNAVLTTLREEKIEALQSLLKKMYSQSWLSTVGNHVNRWLLWKPNMETAEWTVNDLHLGPGFPHKATLTKLYFHYLCGPLDSQSHWNDLQPLQVSLGEYGRQRQKLGYIRSHLWTHAAMYGSHSGDPRMKEKVHLTENFLHFLHSLKPLIHSTGSDSYCDTLTLLHHHLHLNSAEEARAGLGKLTEKLAHIQWAQLQTAIQQCFVSMINVLTLTKCHSNQHKDSEENTVIDGEKSKTGEDHREDNEDDIESRRTYLTVMGEAWVHLGVAKTLLLTPSVPVDPVERTSIRITHCKQELANIECELTVRNDHHRMMTGEDLTSLSHDLLHPHVLYLMQRKLRLKQKLTDLQCQQAYRPDVHKFHRLTADINSYMSSIGAPTSIKELLHKLSETSDSGGRSNAVSQERMWQKSQAAFIQGLDRNFPHYKDLTVPFCVAVQQIRRGIRLVAIITEEKQEEQRQMTVHRKNTYKDLHSLILKLARFPTITKDTSCNLDLVHTLTSPAVHNLLKTVCKCTDESVDMDTVLLARLNHSMLQQTYSSLLLRKELTPEVLSSLNKIIHQFMLAWQHQEDLRQRKEAENSLYKYKTKVHGDERDHDAIEEAEFLQNFPSFQKDFHDVLGSQSLEDNMLEDMEVEDMSSMEEDNNSVLTEEDITLLCHVHHTVFTQMTSADWLRPVHTSKVNVKDIISSLLTNYRIAAVLFNNSMMALSNNLDQYLCGIHLLAVTELQSQILHLEESTNVQADSASKVYDVYHDPNIQEVLRCPPVLERLVTRVTALQIEWPDHPVLKQLTEIVRRILSFPLTAPIIKYLTGLELLVEKAQEWESNAAKHVSLMKELGDISLVIMEWRKLELSCWSQCLDVVQKKQSQNACKWWFFLLQLIQSESTEQDEVEVMKTLKEFMEQSTLGEYEARLSMLRAFHCHMINMELDSSKEYMKKFLWNLYHFYHQFLQIVQDKIQQLRAPIEKELKGFVKIARWTDMNYWALKQSTEKTHRTLHKHIKTFKSLLMEPVKGILSEVDPSLDGGGLGAMKEEITIKLMSSVNPTLASFDSVSQTEDPFLQALDIPLYKKLPSLIHKAAKHWKSLTTHGHVFSKLTVSLEEFTGEVIQTTLDLQSLQLTQGADKDKQRSEAKHIGLKKRKALADLFKYLAQLGLSHRKGLVLSSSQSADLPLLAQPVDLCALSISHGISEIWQSCHQYYYKCIARKSRFTSALQTPSKELGVGNIERCKGFIDHLNTLVLDQFSTIARLSHHWKTFRSLLHGVQCLQTSSNHPDQDRLQEWMVQVKNMLVSVIEGLHQFEVLLKCCPQAMNEELHPSPYPRGSLCQMAVVRQDEELWTSCIQLVQEMSVESEKLYDEVLRVNKHSLCTWDDLSMLSEALQKTETFLPKLSYLESVFMAPGETKSSSFTDTLTVLRTRILSVCQRFREWYGECIRRRECLDNSLAGDTCHDDSHTPVIQEFADHVEDLIASLLLVIQSLTKSNDSRREEMGKNDDVHEMADDLDDGLLVKKLDLTLQEDLESLQCAKIMSKLGDLTDRLRGMWEENYPNPRDSTPSSQLLLHCLPLLHQYSHILEYYLLQLLACHKACSKLLSVLLGIFTELAAKGFCTPAEFEDEVSGEGATEFEDIEGGGMGEGEGAKDVSDQIENEDQLDEAQKAGEKKEEDTSNQPDIKSEDNAIEMSEDFEGKMQDLEEADLEEGSEDDKEEEEELDKQMGEVDEDDADKLDEQMWGGDDTEEQEDKPEKDEFGPGAEQEQTSELVANEDNKDQTEARDGQNKQEKEEEEKDRTNDKDMFDETEYDDDKVDPTSHQQPEQQTDAMELPDTLDLDEEEAERDEESQDQDEEMMKSEGEEEETGANEDNEVKEAEEESSEEVPEMDPQKREIQEENGDVNDDVNETEHESHQEEQKNEDPVSDKEEGVNSNSQEGEEAADEAQAAKHAGKTTHDSQNVEQSDLLQDQAGEGDNDQEETEGSGVSQSEISEGHEGQMSSKVKAGMSQQMKKPLKRKPGKSDSNRSLGNPDQKYKKLKTTEQSLSDQQENSEDVAMETDMYEHIKDPSCEHDAQTVDTATEDQQTDQSVPKNDMEMEESQSNDADMEQEDRKTEEQSLPAGLKKKAQAQQKDGHHDDSTTDDTDADRHEVEGDVIATMSVDRKPESTIHTTLENLYMESKAEVNIEKLRAELEEQLTTFTHTENLSSEVEHSAADAWQKYETLTSALSQELCEQLRLVLEPSQATKLRGDYRTGKRLNMRKVIPYIASQFRKDKIWLRRTKPSKRQYQVLLAIDDSSSMVDNHSKQIAYESLALLANGLALLEVGELAICSFGETVKLLHPFTEQFTSHSGARILQHFTFEQKKTKIAQLLKQTTAIMMEARSRQHGSVGNPDTSQLLLIVSDGRGLFIEGMETVKSAVRKAREANIFLVFVIIDSPHNKDSVLDIKVPVFKSATQIPEIKSYMDHFPFPFYIILRDINNLPEVMSDALRQWFELVTAGDR